ncbi:hypothetical protein QBC37DRAFT_423514 [Rhypophila decipiens]|uniref:Extracellular membrane protein CFEM domain-containing protein n=1 Tax=Rhypophila decipiens TaxID=261697 RepID=A0AAN6Y795_9PEZI|nr:hypothetical protein QBC37DRAFT_423514 [Rhypophila decipiens]
MRVPSLIHLLLTGTLVLAGGPGGPSNAKSAPAGPDKLAQCGCSPITDKMAECQAPVTGTVNEFRDCVCLSNDKPGAWYGYIHNCRACLWADNGDDDNAQTFFDNLASVISQLMVSCTNPGGGVFSDGLRMCASNSMFEACASLNGGRESWASFERDGEVSNATFFLNIDGQSPDSGSSITSSSSSAAGATLAPSSGISSSLAPTQAPTGTGIGTDASSTATTTTTSSARVLIHAESQLGGLVALLAAFSMGALWL